MIDRYYTPPCIAHAMITAVKKKTPAVVADFTAGSGELLLHAQKRWPKAVLVGTDIDPSSVQLLKRRIKVVRAGRCHFLSDKSRSQCVPLKGLVADVSILNPPYSYRGTTRHSVIFAQEHYSCTPAVAFVVNSLRYLDKKGELVTLLPSGVLTNESDEDLWKMLGCYYKIELIAEYERGGFPQCDARTSIVRLSSSVNRKKPVPFSRPSDNGVTKNEVTKYEVTLVRGSVHGYKKQAEGLAALPFVHSTELQDGKVVLKARKTTDFRRAIQKPAVLLPRVGRPSLSKVCLFKGNTTIVLSDCVIGIMCFDIETASGVYDIITNNWNKLEKAYGGTCARYISLYQLSVVLRTLNIRAVKLSCSD